MVVAVAAPELLVFTRRAGKVYKEWLKTNLTRVPEGLTRPGKDACTRGGVIPGVGRQILVKRGGHHGQDGIIRVVGHRIAQHIVPRVHWNGFG